ncbi:MAG TPA: putative glycoside hydrolase [Gemmatimonadales bacterium]|nr:putative glycoside hydrolase [Gemmatimonadales bacterium]
MRFARQASALLSWAALLTSRGLFAQSAVDTIPAAQADQARVVLRTFDVRYVQPALPILLPTPRSVKALYVNAWAFGSPKFWQLVRLADETEINAFVVDVKDDTGCLLYVSTVPTAQDIGANNCTRAKDARARIDTMLAHGIYPIARIVVAKDPRLAERKPQWSVHLASGDLWRDRIGSAWVDAYNDSVWIYSAQLAREAVHMGFAELQFDYVRFPDEPRERLATAIFSARRPGDSPRRAVARHVQLVKSLVAPLGAPVTFDIFGLTASATDDMGIGQVWGDFSSVADIVLPMVYPSHYQRGAYGFKWPNGEPYKIVRRALEEALARSQAPDAAAIRPYLQAFTLGRRLPRYGPREIRAQIRATEDVGINSWVLWNPRSVYQRDALRPYRTVIDLATDLTPGGD